MPTAANTLPDQVDVLIIGAGISGIGAGSHLVQKRPQTTFALLDGRDDLGGTWDQFRFPGIRSDSDLHTFGYAFKPWTNKKAIAQAHLILDYLNETVDEHGFRDRIHFGNRVESAAWDSSTARWTVTARQAATGETVEVRCRYLFSGTGYYDYDTPYSPEFPGAEDFQGPIVHPQHWPEDLDYTGKRVVVIGSGATAVTLVPAMAPAAAHVTMLQRSPSYFISMPSEDPIAKVLNRVLGQERGYRLTRRKNVFFQRAIYRSARRWPTALRRMFMAGARHRLPKGYDVDTHFNPPYDPWDQRLCLVPDGDFFEAVSDGSAEIVTDRIERFTAGGIRLASGRELEADVIVTATGLNILPLGGIPLVVDGQAVDIPSATIYKSMMLSDVPNYVFAFGYTNSSWTLKVDLVCEHFCRLLDHMDARGMATFVPRIEDEDMERVALLDLAAGYVQRRIAMFPKAGTSGPWTAHMAYEEDVARLIHGPVEDPALHVSPPPVPAAEESAAAA